MRSLIKITIAFIALLIVRNTSAQYTMYFESGIYVNDVFIMEGDTITGIKVDTTGWQSLDAEHYLPTIEFMKDYIARYLTIKEDNYFIADTASISNIYSENGLKIDGDSINIGDLTIIAGRSIFNKKHMGGGKFSYVSLSNAHAHLNYSNGAKGGSIQVDSSGKAVVMGINFHGDNMSFEVFENKAYLIYSTNDTLYKFKVDSFIADSISATFKDIKIHDFLLLTPLSSAPGTPSEGDIYYNAVDHKLYCYDGTTWQGLW